MAFKFQTMGDAFAWAQERIGDDSEMTMLQRNSVVSQLDRLYRTGQECPDCGQLVWLPGSVCDCGALRRPPLRRPKDRGVIAFAALFGLAALAVWRLLRYRG